jgi:hypothetical protein
LSEVDVVHGGLEIVASDNELFRHSGEVKIIRGGDKASDAENMLRQWIFSRGGFKVIRDSQTASAMSLKPTTSEPKTNVMKVKVCNCDEKAHHESMTEMKRRADTK